VTVGGTMAAIVKERGLFLKRGRVSGSGIK
jgi:hypothetical protein